MTELDLHSLTRARRRLAAALLVLSTASALLLTIACPDTRSGAPESGDPDESFDRMHQASRKLQEVLGPYQASGNLLGEVLKLRSITEELTEDDELLRSMYCEMASTAESFLGNTRQALELYDRAYPGRQIEAADPVLLSELKSVDAVTALVRAARSSRAVFINEAHHVAQHRALTRRLLPLLREEGFTHFAAETLSEVNRRLRRRGYPNLETGYYTREPLYGDLVRVALDLGYQIVAYESEAGPPAEREPGQARNLAERIFKDPEARALVHLGYAHNEEAPDSFGGVGAMASHFKTLTGIDPLTIDQTRMSERSHPSREDPLFQHVADTLGIDQPVVFVDVDGELWHRAGDSRDVNVFLPRTRYENGRPEWLRLGGQRRPLALPEDVCGAADSCLVEARLAEEGDDAIPIDRVEVSSQRELPVLLVPEERLQIQVLDAEKRVLRSWTHPGSAATGTPHAGFALSRRARPLRPRTAGGGDPRVPEVALYSQNATTYRTDLKPY